MVEAARAGSELVDEDRLRGWLDEHLPGAEHELVVSKMEVTNASNEMFELRRGPHRWALRRPPRVKNDPSAHAVLREFRLLEALEGTDVPHPRPLAACADESVLGAPFYVMEHLDGFSPHQPLPAPFDEPARRHPLGIELVDVLARVGRVDWRAAGLDDFGKPDGFLERQVDRWLGQLERYRTRELDDLDEVAAWLREHRPAAGEPGIMHGDYSFFNVLFAPESPRIVAVVDWETSTIGDPLLDLGWVLGQWSEPGEEPIIEIGITHLEGMATRAELAERYAQRSGRSVAHVRYYMALAVFKLACILEGGYYRYAHGGSDDPRHARLEHTVPKLTRHAAAIARGEWAPELD